MSVERTLAIIKPDAWPQHGGEIITVATQAGLVPVEMKVGRLAAFVQFAGDPPTWSDFYVEHAERSFFKALVGFMASGSMLAMVLEGEDAIKKWRVLMGPTDSRKASMETIRGKFGARMQMRPAPCPAAPNWANGRHHFATGDQYFVAGWFCMSCSRALAVIRESDIARDVDYPMWRNAVHGSDSPEAAAREISFFF